MDHFDVMNIIIFTAKVDTLTHKNEDVAVHSTTQVLAAFLNLWPVFFSIWVFFHEHSQITGLQGNGEDISFLLTTTPSDFTDT